MGNSGSTYSCGWRVVRIQPGSPGQACGLEPWFDFIVGINEVPLLKEDNTFVNIVKNSEGKPVKLLLFNTRTQSARDTTLLPKSGWGGEGLLGISIRFTTIGDVNEGVWRVLEVYPNTPASKAGLVGITDWVLGHTQSDVVTDSELGELIRANIGKQLTFCVFSSHSHRVREVAIVPQQPTPQGSLGCELGSGLIHRLPFNPQAADDAPVPPQATTSSSVYEFDFKQPSPQELVASLDPAAPPSQSDACGPRSQRTWWTQLAASLLADVGSTSASQQPLLPAQSVTRLLRGDPHLRSRLPRKEISVYLSATFVDTQIERGVLLEDVFPFVRDFCHSCGYSFRLVDLSFGVPDLFSDDHQLASVCLQELERCEASSVGPCFLSFVTDAYGFRPLPLTLTKPLYKALVAAMSDDDAALMSKWFDVDTNAVPPVHRLLSITSVLPDYACFDRWRHQAAREAWNAAMEQLQHAIRTASQTLLSKGTLTPDDALPLQQSLNHHLSSASLHACGDDALAVDNRLFVLVRSLEGVPAEDAALSTFIDVTSENKKDEGSATQRNEHLAALKARLPSAQVHEYTLPWIRNEGVSKSGHSKQLLRMCDVQCEVLLRAAAKAIKANNCTPNPLVEEAMAHAAYGNRLCEGFVGRTELLSTLEQYVTGREHSAPLVVFGGAGAGKSCLMAESARQMGGKGHVVISRHVGASAASLCGRQLLRGLCDQISFVYSREPVAVIDDFHSMAAAFHTSLASATLAHPLVLYIDGVDALSGEGLLSWLPTELPPHVSLIVATTVESAALDGVRSVLGDGCLVEVTAFSSAERSALLDFWMKTHSRTLEYSQKSHLVATLDACPQPLFASLSLRQCLLWASYTPNPRLKRNIGDAIASVFNRLASTHGNVLVSHSLGYLSVSRFGLAVNELEDVLSLDDIVLDDAFQLWTPPLRRFPQLLFARIRSDLGPMLVERWCDGTWVLAWAHAQFAELAYECLVACDIVAVERHRTLADYFQGTFKDGRMYTDEENGKSVMMDRFITDHSAVELPHSVSGCDRRRVSCLPHHLIGCADWEGLRTALLDLSFILAALSTTSHTNLLEVFKRALAAHSDPEVRLVMNALSVMDVNSALQPQIVGALALHAQKYPAIASLVASAFKWAPQDEVAWICPVNACLEMPSLAQVATLASCSSCVFAVSVCAAAQKALAAGDLDAVFVWDLATGRCTHALRGHTAAVTSVALVAGGRLGLSASLDCSLRVWDVELGQQVCEFNTKAAVMGMAMASSRVIACLQDRTTLIWNWTEGDGSDGSNNHVFVPGLFDYTAGAVHYGWDHLYAMLLSPDQQTAVSCLGNAAVVWEVATAKITGRLLGHEGDVRALAFVSGVTTVVSGGDDGTVRVWMLDAAAAYQLRHTMLGHASRVFAVAATSQGVNVLTASEDSTLRLWDTDKGTQLRCVRGHQHHVYAVASSGVGLHAVTGGYDGTLRQWDLSAPADPSAHQGHSSGAAMTTVCTVDNKQRVVTGDARGVVCVRESKSGQVLHTLALGEGSVHTAVMAATQAVSVVSDSFVVKVWDWSTGAIASQIDMQAVAGLSCCWTAVACDAARHRVAVAGGMDVAVVDARAARLLNHMRTEATSAPGAVAFFDGGSRLLTSNGADVHVWNLDSAGSEYAKRAGSHQDVVSSIRVSEDRQWAASGSHDCTVYLWALPSVTLTRTIAQDGWVKDVAISADNQFLLVATMNQTVSLFEFSAAGSSDSETRPLAQMHLDAYAMCVDAGALPLIFAGDAQNRMCALHLRLFGDSDDSVALWRH